MTKTATTKRILLTSFFASVLDVAINTVIAIFTGSAVMLAAALQGLADLISVAMLLVGLERSQKRSSKKHPFGYGKELYFWTILSIFMIIGITATLSFYSGLQKWRNPDEVEYILIAYLALIVAVVTNGYAFFLSLRKILQQYSIKYLPRLFMESSDVAPKTTLVIDAMGSLAAILGLTALILYKITGDARFDGLGAMAIGVLLFILALTLLFTTKSLVTGRSAPKELEDEIKIATKEIPEIKKVLDLRTMIMGSNTLLINLKVHIKDNLSTDEIENVIDAVKENIQKNIPGRTHITIEPETPPKEH